MGVSKNNGTPKSSILIGFSIIFTIHFGGPINLEPWFVGVVNQLFNFLYIFLPKKKHLPQENRVTSSKTSIFVDVRKTR